MRRNLPGATAALAEKCGAIAHQSLHQAQRGLAFRAALAALLLDPRHKGRRGLFSVLVRATLGHWPIHLLHRLQRNPAESSIAALQNALQATPLDPVLHSALGQLLAADTTLSGYACVRTALGLAEIQGQPAPPGSIEAAQVLERDLLALPPAILHSQGDPYGRVRTLAGRITADFSDGEPIRVADIGGGSGLLALLLSKAHYVLVEPTVNGLQMPGLALSPQVFDVVVCSHVLEHVPPEQRQPFLESVLQLARRSVLLLGPFDPPDGTAMTEQAIWTIANSDWAREHIANGLPVLQNLCAFLEQKGLKYQVQPYADAHVMYWQFWANYFAEESGQAKSIAEATAFFDQHMAPRPAAEAWPHDFLIQVEI